MKSEFSRQIFEKYSNIKFREDPPSGGPKCSIRTDRHDEANSRFSQFCERAYKHSITAHSPAHNTAVRTARFSYTSLTHFQGVLQVRVTTLLYRLFKHPVHYSTRRYIQYFLNLVTSHRSLNMLPRYGKPTRCNSNNLLMSKMSSTCFGQTSAHLQERKTEIFYSIWYSVLLLW